MQVGTAKNLTFFVKRAGWRAGSEVPPDSGARRVVVGGQRIDDGTMSYVSLKADQERAPKFITHEDENESDTDGYHRYYICFRIFDWIRIQIRIVSAIPDRIRFDANVINM
jgi:hypothetical protein